MRNPGTSSSGLKGQREGSWRAEGARAAGRALPVGSDNLEALDHFLNTAPTQGGGRGIDACDSSHRPLITPEIAAVTQEPADKGTCSMHGKQG